MRNYFVIYLFFNSFQTLFSFVFCSSVRKLFDYKNSGRIVNNESAEEETTSGESFEECNEWTTEETNDCHTNEDNINEEERSNEEEEESDTNNRNDNICQTIDVLAETETSIASKPSMKCLTKSGDELLDNKEIY